MISVVVPATRPSIRDLIWSLNLGEYKPDEILIVTNEDLPFDEPGSTDAPVYRVGFDSVIQPYGEGDAGLRRNIGADLAEGDIIIFLDDDQVVPRGMVESAVEIAARDGFCWGHHRFLDFDRFSVVEMLDMSPSRGRSRETEPNRWHGWESSYAGNLTIRRDLFWEIGGFDLGYLGFHGSEDQQFGRRLSRGSGRTYVHEPPFAWHPEVDRFHSEPASNIIGMHQMVQTTINGHVFLACEKCPCRKPLNVLGLTMSEQVVVPYSREQFTLSKERI